MASTGLDTSLLEGDVDLFQVATEFDQVGVGSLPKESISTEDRSLLTEAKRGVTDPCFLRGALPSGGLAPDEEDWAEVSGISMEAVDPIIHIHRSAAHVGASVVAAVMAWPGEGDPEGVDRAIHEIISEAKKRADSILNAVNVDANNPLYDVHKARLFRSQCDNICRGWIATHKYGRSKKLEGDLNAIYIRVISQLRCLEVPDGEPFVQAQDRQQSINEALLEIVGKIEVASSVMEEIGCIKFDYGHSDPLTSIALVAAETALMEVRRAGAGILSGEAGKSPDGETVLFMALINSSAKIYRSIYRYTAQEDISSLLSKDKTARAAEVAKYMLRDQFGLKSGMPTSHIHEKFRLMFRRMVEMCSPKSEGAIGAPPVSNYVSRNFDPAPDVPDWL